MKVAYRHLLNFIPSKPSINEISEKLFQLGHEHEIKDKIFDMELTPNRGDCLSINGLLRDLAVFFKINYNYSTYSHALNPLKLDFTNLAPDACSNISFLKIDIEGEIGAYKGLFNDYFIDLDINKNNFFTDVSNYISYETGQPTHCYDAEKFKEKFVLDYSDQKYEFETLFGDKIQLKDKNLVFIQDGAVINLAGVMGGKKTACNSYTKSVMVECAYFNPEYIIGQSLKYGINSEAAHKFERGVDPLSHQGVLGRFLKIVEEHAKIKNVQAYKNDYISFNAIQIPLDIKRINKILGISLDQKEIQKYLSKLGFEIVNNNINVPSYRSDIKNNNDIAEEIARAVGYNNISPQSFQIPKITDSYKNSQLIENNLKNLLIKSGFFEVINSPFTSYSENNSIKVDNPLDSNRENIRTNLEQSLVENLIYNERRQQDSIKLFEISDVYQVNNSITHKRMVGIICSGRVGRNYVDFSKKLNKKYLTNLLLKNYPDFGEDLNVRNLSRDKINSKLKNDIAYLEVELDAFKNFIPDKDDFSLKALNKDSFTNYKKISEFPSSYRDLSFSVKDSDSLIELQSLLINLKHELVKEIYIFDFFNNQKKNEAKIGFRFIFQSHISTITEEEVSKVMKRIIDSCLAIKSVTIPGLDL